MRAVTIWGIILILLGAVLLSRTLDLFYFDFGDFIRIVIPLGLIAAGAWLIIRKKREEQMYEAQVRYYANAADADTPPSAAPGETPAADSKSAPDSGIGQEEQATKPRFTDSRVRYSKVLGDIHIDCRNINTRNIEVSAFVGDVEVDLKGARLQPGLNRMVISGFAGDLRVLVPTDMAVFANCSSFVGDIEVFDRRSSGFGNNIDGQTGNYREAESKLYIAANSFVGDIRIYEV
jgi:lia operon protein LiaF